LIKKLFQQLSYKVFAPGFVLRNKYEAFKELLTHDSSCHELMAWIQDAYHGPSKMDLAGVAHLCEIFSQKVALMIDCLNRLAPGDYVTLIDYHRKFDFYIRFLLAPPPFDTSPPFTLGLDQVQPKTDTIGNKGKNLGLIENRLNGPVPPGFIITTNSYHYFIEYNDLREPIRDLLTGLDIEVPDSLRRTSERIKRRILNGEVPEPIETEILHSFQNLQEKYDEPLRVAVRSSAACEDGEFSFAGQYLTRINVDKSDLIDSYRQVLASKYSPEALFYRVSYGLFDEETPMSVLVLKMVDSVASGVLYTQSPVNHGGVDEFQHLHVISGQGEMLVSGRTKPDIYTLSRSAEPELIDISGAEQISLKTVSIISDEIARSLGRWGHRLEQFFGAPQDIEWAVDDDGKLFLLQTRPLQVETEIHQVDPPPEVDQDLHPIILAEGRQGAKGCGSGPAYLVSPDNPVDKVPQGAILVTENTPPEYVQVMNRLSGVVAEKSSTACHFATIAREFGVPLLVGCPDAARILKNRQQVTIDANQVKVYEGNVEALTQADGSHPLEESHYHQRLGPMLSFIAPLKLVDPTSKQFVPESCRSMHDIIRFVHEKGVQSMFMEAKPGTGRGAIKLSSDLPLEMYLFNVGGGFSRIPQKGAALTLDLITCTPFLAVWKGLSHPDVRWKNKPFDWDSYDKIVMSGGIAPKQDDFQFSSYGVVSTDYLHLNMRFGYHFTILDILCGDVASANYCMLRFAGGGADFEGRSLRLEFLSRVFLQLGFTVQKKADLLEARLADMDEPSLAKKLDMVGRLLGATKIMDMVLHDEEMVDKCVHEFFNGRYHFSGEE